MKTQHKNGFTLVELMLAIIVVAILATIAVPTYLHYVRNSYRTNALQALTTLQLEQEKYRYSNTAYSSALSNTYCYTLYHKHYQR